MLVELAGGRFDLLVLASDLVVNQHLVDPARGCLPETGDQLVAQPVALGPDQDRLLARVVDDLLNQQAHLVDLVEVEGIDLGHLRQLIDGVATVHRLNQDEEAAGRGVDQLDDQFVITQLLLGGQVKIGRLPITGLDRLEEGFDRAPADPKDGPN